MSENLSIRDSGLNELVSKFTRFDLPSVIAANMAQGGEDVVSAAKASTAFNDRTGNLRSGFKVLSVTNMGMVVGSDVNYDPFVEFGTSRMSERPHWRPALAEVIPRMREDVRSAIVRMLNG